MRDKITIYNLYYSWWKNLDKTIFSIIILLFTIGLFFSLVSTSLIASDKLETNSYSFFFKHLIYLFLGITIIILLSAIDSISLLKFSLIFFFIILLLLFLVPLIGVEVKGSKRWIDLFILPRFQPIELLKPFFIIFLATILSTEKRININLKYIFSFLTTLLISGLLFIQPDIGQTLLILFTWSVLIFTSGVSILFLSIFASSALIFLVYLVMFIPKFSYIKSRILSFFDQESGTHNFQSDKALDSISSGGFFGKGLGEGTLKNTVPEAHTDYIISVISEEFGVIAIMLIIMLFLIFIYTVFKRILILQEDRYKLILVGCSSLILMQAMIHIGVNIRLFPTTGMTLPFLSYGGSSIISISIISGIILNLTKRKIN
jgi:cell division protein FtsW